MKNYDEDDPNTAEEKSVVVASISFDEAVGPGDGSRYSIASGASQQQSPYISVPMTSKSQSSVPVPLTTRNTSASACDIIRQTPAGTDKGSPGSLSSRTPRDRRPFSETAEERILQDENQARAVQNGTAKIKAHKRKQKQNQQVQQLQQQHLIQQQQVHQHQQLLQQQQFQQRQLQEQQKRLKEKSPQGRFVFERNDDKTVMAAADRTTVMMMAANGQPRRDQKRTARVTPECCSGAAAAAATAAGGAAGINSWQLATRAGHSSTVDSRRRAPQAKAAAQRRQRRNRSAENLLAQCDCDRRFSEDQASRPNPILMWKKS